MLIALLTQPRVPAAYPRFAPDLRESPEGQARSPAREYILSQNGFARDLPWQLDELSDGGRIRFVLESNPQPLATSPFSFRLS